jgi:hypothetical protein
VPNRHVDEQNVIGHVTATTTEGQYEVHGGARRNRNYRRHLVERRLQVLSLNVRAEASDVFRSLAQASKAGTSAVEILAQVEASGVALPLRENKSLEERLLSLIRDLARGALPRQRHHYPRAAAGTDPTGQGHPCGAPAW